MPRFNLADSPALPTGSAFPVYNNDMFERADILIIGGGVIGLTVSYFLAREGVRVEVVDQGDFGQEASWAGAGILPPGDPDHSRTAIDLLRSHSAALFPNLSAELKEQTGIDNGYLRSGGLEFLGEEGEEIAAEWRRQAIRFEVLSGTALRQCEPALANELDQAYFLPDMAQLRNPRHVKALLAWCSSHGVSLRSGCPVHQLERKGDRITGIKTGMGRLTADRYLLASGAWTDPLLEQVGWKSGIRPVRGQIALVHCSNPLFTRVLLQGKRYLVPRPDGHVLIGSTEEDAGFDKHTTAGAIGGLLAFALGLVPGLGEAPLERCWAGLRPGSPDGLPFLGSVPGVENLFLAAGHYRAGIQLSPATGLVLKELLLGQALTVPLEPFRLDRPPGPLLQQAFRS